MFSEMVDVLKVKRKAVVLTLRVECNLGGTPLISAFVVEGIVWIRDFTARVIESRGRIEGREGESTRDVALARVLPRDAGCSSVMCDVAFEGGDGCAMMAREPK